MKALMKVMADQLKLCVHGHCKNPTQAAEFVRLHSSKSVNEQISLQLSHQWCEHTGVDAAAMTHSSQPFTHPGAPTPDCVPLLMGSPTVPAAPTT